MKHYTKLLAALLLSVMGFSAHAQTAATCATAAPGTVWTPTTFLACNGTVTYVAQPIPANNITNDMRCVAGTSTCVFSWMLASNILPTDQVWVKTTAAPNGVWVAASTLKIASTAPPIITSTATLAWVAPTQNTDGSALTNLASYNIYQGATAASLVKVANVAAPAASYAITGLVPGSYAWSVTAVNTAGAESAQSNIATATVTAPVVTPPTPNTPGSLSVTITVSL